jgi:hypothetical protein
MLNDKPVAAGPKDDGLGELAELSAEGGGA